MSVSFRLGTVCPRSQLFTWVEAKPAKGSRDQALKNCLQLLPCGYTDFLCWLSHLSQGSASTTFLPARPALV